MKNIPKIIPVMYAKALKDGTLVWGEDCVSATNDFEEDGFTGVALVRLSDVDACQTNEQGRAADGVVPECQNCNQLVRALREATESPTFMGEPVSQLPSASNWVWQHTKSKGEYRLLGDAKIQTDIPLNDLFDVRVYQDDDGALWVRPTTEFNSKFKRLRPATQPPSASPVAVPEGYKLLKDTTYQERSFDVGDYMNMCCNCGRTFTGHKRQPVCKVCATQPALPDAGLDSQKGAS